MKNSSQEMELYDRLDFIEFRQELLFSNTEVDRMLFEYNISRLQYTELMNIMDKMRQKLDNKETINHVDFEQEIYKRIPHLNSDYHFCEYIARAFMEERRWEEVFPALYGNMPKYKGLFNA